MSPATILKSVLLLGVVLLVMAIGLRVRLEQPWLLLRRPALALRAMGAMYVAMPALVLLLVAMVPLQAPVRAVLLGFSVSPVLPPWARKGEAVGGSSDYVIGLQVLSSAVALLVIPLMLWIVQRLFGVETELEPLAVELVLLITVAAPLGLGLGLARLRPGAAPRLAALADRVGGVLLLVGALILLLAKGPAIVGVLGGGALLVSVAMVALGLLIGHLLGGPDPGDRGALASATIFRHPAIALLLAAGSGKQAQASVVGTVLLYMLAALVVAIPYERWRRSLSGGGSGSPERPAR